MPRFTIPRVAHCDGGALPMSTTAPARPLPAPPPKPPVSWVPNRKWIAWAVTNLLGWIVSFAITKLGIHESASAAVLVSSVIGFLSGAAASYIVKETSKAGAPTASKNSIG